MLFKKISKFVGWLSGSSVGSITSKTHE
uniref:Uncharacterized 3.0 kDa protein in psbT-psbN intergenic region n=1 Tax=Anthoceros angustus TaxID=48387 RepID=YCX2_ANTAG|nr:hypothetical protein AnfoCp057 [Anthoceros angustus]Q85BU5.1 RecName: Full=Uncharacterized 3.0 kDa protein in psbT-psbN intergenic region; AltName: Full=ORF27 [Anthoceros angustus]BAC55377.1 hypothetical protein [Anthoceros angustus]BAC55474.1 hypothetical protein [Anthoceros angustus]